jgi:hypothetical protein
MLLIFQAADAHAAQSLVKLDQRTGAFIPDDEASYRKDQA